jgi:rhodanese-related sulfurtransferase
MTVLPSLLYAHGAKEGAIGPEDLKQQLGTVKLLDIRSYAEYEQAHITSALVIPLKEVSEARLTELGYQKEADLVVYAESDIPAQRAKVLLEAIGYTSVRFLQGGFVHWVEDRFPTVSGKMDVPGAEGASPTTSALVVEPKTFDLGKITKEGGVVTTTFSLTNEGEQPITIEELSTSCGCTSAFLDGKEIPAGATIPLEVRFDPNFHKEPQGRFSRTVFILTSEGIEVQARIYVEIQE